MDKNGLFRQILAENKDRIFRICCAYERDKDERDDLFQEILVNLWKSLSNFEGRASLSTWVYRVALNTSLMHVKSAVRRKKRLVLFEEPPDIINDNSGYDEKIETERLTQKLYYCINKLPDFDRLVISLVLDDLSYKEIADITGMSVNNTGVRINRIKKSLSKMMEEDYNGNQ